MGGIGKTTLARNAYQDPLIIEHFHIRAWVTVSQDYSAQRILSTLLGSMEEYNTGRFGNINDHEKLYKILKGRRYLIVMDDMWSTSAWDDVGRIFPDDNNGSRVLLTTRLSDVADLAGSSSPLHQMHLMDEHQSWNLLQRKVFEHQRCPPDLEDIGKEISRRCGGLPLAIVVIAGFLYTTTPNFWWEIAENLNSAIATTDGQFQKILSLSYTHLPHHLRPCFLYMSAFPEDYEIHTRKLIKLWIAEGFIQSSNSRSFEEVAEEYLEDLVNRSLVMVSRRKSSGKIKSCSIHDLMRELCMRKAKQEKFLLHVTDGIIAKKSIKNQRRLCVTESDLNCLANIFGSTTRTIIYFPHGTGSTGHLENFTFLRLLDVVYDHFNFSHSEETVRFPAHVFELFHLKYLAFYFPITGNGRHVEIPSVISNLENLQTLIIPKKSHQPCIVDLPLEIWRMPQLRHIICFYIGRLPNPEEGATSALENLQTLSEVRDLVCTESIVKMIPNVTKLGLFFSQDENDHQDYHLENLERLRKLEKLKLTANKALHFRRGKVNPTFPRTLKKLSLSGWELSCEDMRIVGSLPNLQVLKLKNFALDGDTWETTEGEFSQLKFLLLHYTDLGHWISESSHFPILKCLFLHHCQYLSEIPDGIGDIPTLELIEVKGDNIYLAQSAKQIQEIQREYGNYDLEVLCIDCIF
ncbi:hypothetical protein ACP275_06G207300 [Erythranthe tilingii]